MVKDAKAHLDAAVKAGRLSPSMEKQTARRPSSSTSTTWSTAGCPTGTASAARASTGTAAPPRRPLGLTSASERARARYPGRVRELAETIERWRARGDRVALATVVATRRSAPRPVGAKLAVSQRGELYRVGLGRLCRERRRRHRGRGARRRHSAAAHIRDRRRAGLVDLGFLCGGEIDVFVEPFEGELPQEPSVTVTVLEGEQTACERLDREVPPGPEPRARARRRPRLRRGARAAAAAGRRRRRRHRGGALPCRQGARLAHRRD